MAESSNSQNNDQTELTMCDVLEEEQELEEDANAVLGGSDDTNCSYDKGYVPRQALYVCTTCSAEEEPSGVCLACSYKCHDGHEIVELYTKRNFKCDCGNSKFPGKTCSLKPDKDPVNHLNKYNQNFKGLYCSCSRPYPDLQDDTPDEMMQCVMCEDWYHGRHIGVVPEDYSEMICTKCMESHKFLYSYLNKFHYVNINDNEDKDKCNGGLQSSCSGDEDRTSPVQCSMNKEQVKNEALDAQTAANQPEQIDASVEETVNTINDEIKVKSEEETTIKQENTDIIKEVKSEHETTIKQENTDITKEVVKSEHETTIKQEDIDIVKEVVKSEHETTIKQEDIDIIKDKVKSEQGHTDCLLNKLNIKHDGIMHGPAFWPENWRKELCQCSSCLSLYHKYDCEYLLNVDDTILAYEERGKSTNVSQYDKGLNALSQLDRVKQMEAIRAYTSMKGQLKEYLKEFANSKRTVCESDIKEFFDRIGKRQRLNNGVPHFCR